MNQRDYSRQQNFRRMPGPVGQPMNGGNFAPQQGYAPQGNFAPQQGYGQPQGNFAPRNNPNFARMAGAQQMMQRNAQMNTGNFQQGDTMPGYSYNGQNWNDIRLGDVRDRMSSQEAEANVEQMDQFIQQMQGQVDLGVSSAGNIDQVVSTCNMLHGLLSNPKEWLPTNTPAKQAKEFGEKGAVVAKYIKIFGDALVNLQKQTSVG